MSSSLSKPGMGTVVLNPLLEKGTHTYIYICKYIPKDDIHIHIHIKIRNRHVIHIQYTYNTH